MNIADFISQMDERNPPASEHELAAFESTLGCRLPEDYRQFLAAANGGVVEDDRFYSGNADAGIFILGIGGVPELIENRDCYQISEQRIPSDLLWIMDDAFSRAVCIGITGTYRGKVYLWNNEDEPGSDWDGKVETAGNLTLLANSFTAFIANLQVGELKKKNSGCAALLAVVFGFGVTALVIWMI